MTQDSGTDGSGNGTYVPVAVDPRVSSLPEDPVVVRLNTDSELRWIQSARKEKTRTKRVQEYSDDELQERISEVSAALDQRGQQRTNDHVPASD
ncbi:hypothetical protein JCM18750_24360 [Halostagnicola bangensis]